MPGGEDFFKDKNDDFSSGRSLGGSGLDASDKGVYIKKIFKRVLGRKPSSRELAYYRYSVMEESEIVDKLLSGDEHKKILKDYKKLPGTEERLLDSENSVRKLSKKIDDISGEIISLKELLDEKGRHIKELREQLNNPYDLPNTVQKYEEGFDFYNKDKNLNKDEVKSKSFIEKVDEILDLLFRK